MEEIVTRKARDEEESVWGKEREVRSTETNKKKLQREEKGV